MKLYLFRGCPFAHRATFVLQEKGLAFEPVIFELGKRPPELDAVSSYARSPTLFDGELGVWDSQIVLDYLEDRSPEPALMPKDAGGRAEVRMLASRLGSEIGARQGALVAEARFKPEPQREPALIEAAIQAVIAAMAPWNQLLMDRSWLHRDALTQADIILFTLLQAFERVSGATIPGELSALRAWYARIAARPASKILAV